MLLGAGLHGEQLSRASGRGQVARTHACLGESCHLSSLSAAGPELPTIVPPELLDLTLVTKPDWMSSRWTYLWTATFSQD